MKGFLIKHKTGGFLKKWTNLGWGEFAPLYDFTHDINDQALVFFSESEREQAQHLLFDNTGYGIGRERVNCSLVLATRQDRYVLNE